MQFQVPQFIETEDKIVGPLSLRQFIYVGVGFLIAALLYFVLQTWLWIFVAAISVGGAIAIAFVKIEGRPLANVITSAVSFYWNPQIYVWQPNHPSLPKTKTVEEESGFVAALQKIAEGAALHKHWEKVQTGEKISDKQFAETKMNERYGIFTRITGDRSAGRRVDYR